MGAEIIQFPGSVKTCAECEWAAFSTYGLYCIQLHEEIWNEEWANECEFYNNIEIRSKTK